MPRQWKETSRKGEMEEGRERQKERKRETERKDGEQKRHRCKEQTSGLCGRRQGWDDLRE